MTLELTTMKKRSDDITRKLKLSTNDDIIGWQPNTNEIWLKLAMVRRWKKSMNVTL